MGETKFLNQHVKKYVYYDAKDIYKDLSTTSAGLNTEQIEGMRKKFGNNQLISKKQDTLGYRIRRAFLNPFTVILFILALISFVADILLVSNFSRNLTTVVIICVMIFISGLIRLIQELSAKNASEKLERLIHIKITVKRNGILTELSAEQLVVGDIVLLSAGDRIPADLRLIETANLFVSQAAITGESAILEKTNRTYAYTEQKALMQFDNLAFMGTTVISGNGTGIVLAVGKDTLYGNFTKSSEGKSSNFQKGANSIAWVMIRFMVILVPIVFVISGITKGNWVESFVFALSVAVGLTPEMLPMVITACLAKGSLSMSRKQSIIKDINAMQGFGSMDILCMDKTGTLTQEKILLEYYMDVLGNENTDVLDFAFLNSKYHSGVFNPIDNAILEYYKMPDKKNYYDVLLKDNRKLDEIPFDYDRKSVSVLVSNKLEEHQLIMKGDITEIINRCCYVMYGDEIIPINEGKTVSVSAVVDEMLDDGMKVIAVAKKILPNKDSINLSDEKDMILMGYLAFFDAPKKSASQSIAALKKLQVKSKILTGDQSQIALSICRRVGIESETIMTGSQLNTLSDFQLQQKVEQINIFAELTPGQKVRVIATLQENGHTVGFLGDGLNDIPAIIEADVGISVDTAVDAAKDAADVILLEKDLNVLAQGILEGRKTFANMLKYIKITASSNFGNIFSIVCACAFLPFLPMTAIQLLLLNLLYDILCIVLPWDNVDEEDVAIHREWSGKTLGRFMLSFGPISSIFDIITFLFLYFILCPSLCDGLLFTQIVDSDMQIRYIMMFQTGWFLESMWTQILIIHMLRTRKIMFLKSRTSHAVFLITLIGILVFTGLTFTPLARLMGLSALPMWYFGYLLIIVISYMLLTTVAKCLYIKKYHELI